MFFSVENGKEMDIVGVVFISNRKKMTTITLDQTISLKKTHFFDINELLLEFAKIYKNNEILQLTKAIYDLEKNSKNTYSEYEFKTIKK
jgi:hypothetical protein